MSQSGQGKLSYKMDSEVVQPGQMPNTLMQDDVGIDESDSLKVFFFFLI